MKKTLVTGKNIYLVQGMIRWGLYDFNQKTISVLDSAGGEFLTALLKTKMSMIEKKLFLEKNCNPLWQKLVNIGVNERLFAPYDEVVAIPKGLDLIWVELTEECNQRCVHCYADDGSDRVALMPFDVACRTIEEASALQFGKIQLTGGELFLHPQVWDIIDVASAGSFEEVEIYTNLTLLDKADLIRLKSLRVKIATSLLGFDSASHDNCTQTPGSFEVWYRNIKYVQSLGIPFRIGIVVMKQNQEFMPRIEDFLRHEGLLPPDKLFTPDEYRPMGRGTDKLVTPTIDNTRYEPYLTVSREYFDRAKSFNPCWKGQAAVTPEGSVFPCVFSRSLKVGDLHDESLGQILSRIENEYWTINLDKIEKCQDCELRYACMDCRAMCLNLGRGLYGPPVRCSYDPYN